MRVRTIEDVSNALTSHHSDPRTFTFLKEDKAWYIDLPDYIKRGGQKKDLEMVAGAGELLTWLARRKSKVTITIDTEPFEGAKKLELLELCDRERGGGYYRLHTCSGREIKKRMWLCDVALFIFGDIPERIYLRTGAYLLDPRLQ